MASTEKSPTRAKTTAAAKAENGAETGAAHDERQHDESEHVGADADLDAEPTTASAVHELTGSLGRAWSEARATVNGIGENLGRRARNVRDETRRAATETRETLGDAASDMADLGEEIAEDAIELGRALGVSVSRFVRKHPVRSVALAAAAGAVLAHLLRRRH